VTFVKRLVLGSVLILVLAVSILLWVAERSLRRDLEGDIGQNLEREARLVREALPADSTAWQTTVHQLATQIGHRITLIDRDGWVRADSDFPIGPLPAIKNHAQRPEVRAALAEGRGVARRRSETVGRPFLYVAIPGEPAVVRVAAGLDQVDEVVRRAQRAVAGAALLALLVGSLLALLAGRSIAQPLPHPDPLSVPQEQRAAGRYSPRRADKRLPAIGLARHRAQEQDLRRPATRSDCRQPGRDDARVVDHQHVSGPKQLPQRVAGKILEVWWESLP